MSLFQTQKPKSAGKVTSTLEHIAMMTGATLGPGGRQVLIERAEMNMKPIITKDGVTVVKNLGYDNPVRQLILESVRDAALRTASEAGDGTTSATILAHAITKLTTETVVKNKNLKISPQRIVREIQALVPILLAAVRKMAYKVDDDNFEDLLKKVASLSANGDEPMAEAIVEAFNLVGDEGNLIILDADGESNYSVEKIKGYTIDIGYEDVLKNFSQGFFNDKTGTMILADKPVFVLYDGYINDTYQILDGLNAINGVVTAETVLVLVAHGFSDAFLGDMLTNWTDGRTKLKVLPIRTPQSAIKNSGTQFLYDLQSYVGTDVYNPTNKTINKLDPQALLSSNRALKFEYNRFRSSIIADEDQYLIEARVDQLKDLQARAESEYERYDLVSRISKLTCGIARMTISAPSQGDIREKKDRAEDAWMAIRGAIKHGALPGGGYVLVRLSALLINLAERTAQSEKKLAMDILSEALLLPVKTLYINYGYMKDDVDKQITELLKHDGQTFDIMQGKWVDARNLLDSTPAVTEAIQNSVSIASLLGTLGGIVSFKRDNESDKEEEKLVRNFTNSLGER
jgi:chaperonin GroEL